MDEAEGAAGAPAGAEIARIEVAPFRRWTGIAMQALLGLLLLWLALAEPPASLALRAGVLAGGVIALALALRLHGATRRGLVLTETELRETGEGGRVLARLDRVRSVDRGAFAFKPSHGFLLNLAPGSSPGRAWAPGLWWRIGDRVGVGGVLRASETRFIAEAIDLQLRAEARGEGS